MNQAELDLIKAIKARDEKAFREFFFLYYKDLYKYATFILKREVEADDILQEVFLSVWNQGDKLNVTVSFNSYLYRAVYLKCIKLLQKHESERKHQVNYSRIIREAFLLENYFDKNIPASLFEKEFRLKLKTAVENLPNKTRQTFQLSRNEGLKNHEITKKMQISIKAVEANMTRALKLLKRNLKEFLPFFLL